MKTKQWTVQDVFFPADGVITEDETLFSVGGTTRQNADGRKHLIAAAPELLAAFKSVTDGIEMMAGKRPDLRALIARAEGK
jgi:hypothetical protein